ncbi:hypothetical protein [Amycolatopsis sp. FDAARGOS 1241]|nr:hypothetical protein [Amycolatopsis sp. FDAARGOS 1241]QRP43015.1 hypothetical protein I6J71_26640 [Amycolatopsis sp. FDAARGOS 1241]
MIANTGCVVTTAGTQVFLARETGARLTDKILDVTQNINGHYTFRITTTN